MLSIGISRMNGGYEEKKKNKLKSEQSWGPIHEG